MSEPSSRTNLNELGASDTNQSPEGQFGLMKQRRFAGLFWTQFLGAFNDNAFKSAVTLLFVYGGLVAADMEDIVVNLAAALFILPFFLFSAIAGQIADKYPKELLIRRIKLCEIGIVIAGAIAVYSGSVVLMLLVLFLLGTQSTFFGPLKFSILPQHLAKEELIGGNAQIEMGTFVAILLGTLVGGIVAGQSSAITLLALLTLVVAIMGYGASRFIPHAPPAAPDLKVNWAIISETRALMAMAAEKYSVLLSIMGISWFWLIGSALLAQFPGLTERVLLGDTTVVTLILCVFTLSIAAGSLACERLSGKQIEIGLVPLGALGMSLAGVHAYFSIGNIEEYLLASQALQRDWVGFLGASGSLWLLLDFAIIGVSGGMFIVPLYAFIQSNTPEDRRARIIAVNNVINALFMVSGNLFCIALLEFFDTGIPNLLLILILMHIVVTAYIFKEIPVFIMRFIVWVLGHSLYRVSHHDLDKIPEEGAAVIVSNHVSYVDALILAGAVRRPIRFVMDKPIFDIPVLNFVFRTSRAIPICRRADDEAAYEAAFDEIRAGLEAGDLLCIFPEGKLTKTGEIDEFKPGIERIIRETAVPVIPMALRGLWGSWFSPQDGLFSGRMRPFSQIDVVAGDLVPASAVDASDLQGRVSVLRGDCP